MDFNKTCMDHVYYQWKIHVVDNWIDYICTFPIWF
jgi:hypothetical protein